MQGVKGLGVGGDHPELALFSHDQKMRADADQGAAGHAA